MVIPKYGLRPKTTIKCQSLNRKTKKILKRYLTEVTSIRPNHLHILNAHWNPFEPDFYISKYNHGKRLNINSIEFVAVKHGKYKLMDTRWLTLGFHPLSNP